MASFFVILTDLVDLLSNWAKYLSISHLLSVYIRRQLSNNNPLTMLYDKTMN
jgi:hypothetical protein